MWSPSPAHSAALSLVSAWLLVTPALRAAEGDLLYSRVLAFDVGDTLGDTPAAIAAAPDGKIVQFGTVVTGAGTWKMALARYLPNGTLDTGFGTGGKVVNPFLLTQNSWGVALHLLPNGQILVAGTVDFGGGNHNLLVGSLDPNGVPNELFGVSGEGYTFETISTGGDNTDDLGAMTVDRFGRIVVVGTVDAGPTDTEIGVARFTAGGVWDDSFSGNGNTMIAIAAAGGKDLGLAIAIDNQDRIIVGGAAWSTSSGTDFDWALAVLDSAGTLDPSFDTDGIWTYSADGGGGPRHAGISRSGPTARSWPAETGRSAPPGGRRPSSPSRRAAAHPPSEASASVALSLRPAPTDRRIPPGRFSSKATARSSSAASAGAQAARSTSVPRACIGISPSTLLSPATGRRPSISTGAPPPTRIPALPPPSTATAGSSWAGRSSGAGSIPTSAGCGSTARTSSPTASTGPAAGRVGPKS